MKIRASFEIMLMSPGMSVMFHILVRYLYRAEAKYLY